MSAFCECGQRKTNEAIACMRCTYLDGSRNAAVIIATLRQLGPSSVSEIVEVNGVLYRETTQRTLNVMLRAGRVRRYWREGEAFETERNVFAVGGGRTSKRVVASSCGCFVYTLTERT